MKINQSKLSTAILLSLGIGLATTSVVANDFSSGAIEAKFDQADIAITQMNDIRAAIFMFFDEQGAFPANLAVLTDPTQQYYAGLANSPFGTPYSGQISGDGRFFEISISFPSEEVARYVAERVNTQAVGNNVVLSVGTPASQTLWVNSLSRTRDPSRPELNEMETDLSLGWNNLNNVDVVNANTINITNIATADQLVALSSVTTLDFTSTGTSTLNNANVTNQLTAKSANISDVGYQ